MVSRPLLLSICKFPGQGFLTQDGVLQIYDGRDTLPTTLMDDVVWINGYKDAMIIIDQAGCVYGFGDFGNYLAGEPCLNEVTLLENSSHFVQGDVGKDHILLLDDAGNLFSLGGNSAGELGNGSRSTEPQPLQYVMSDVVVAKAGIGTSYALTSDGKMYAWGRNDLGQLETGVHIASFKIGKGHAVNDDLTYAGTHRRNQQSAGKLSGSV